MNDAERPGVRSAALLGLIILLLRPFPQAFAGDAMVAPGIDDPAREWCSTTT